ncbi:MAG: hypothetical protein QOE35_2996 [Actinomycetota bacterium]|jgi:hypothetical protein
MMRRLAVLVLVAGMGAGACHDGKTYSYVLDTNRGRLGWRQSANPSRGPCVALKPATGDVAEVCPIAYGPPGTQLYGGWVDVGGATAVIGFLASDVKEWSSSGVGVIRESKPISALEGRRLFVQLVDDGVQTERSIRLTQGPDPSAAGHPTVTITVRHP